MLSTIQHFEQWIIELDQSLLYLLTKEKGGGGV